MKKIGCLMSLTLVSFFFVIGVCMADPGMKKMPSAETMTSAPTIITGPGATKTPLDHAALKRNVVARVAATFKERGKELKGFDENHVVIDTETPVRVGNADFYMVKLKLTRDQAPEGEPKDSYMPMIVDPSGSFQVAEMTNINTGLSVFMEARNSISKVELPKSFGDVLYTGPGTHEVVFVSDPFCPFCRKAWNFLRDKKTIKTFRFVHKPIAQLHPAAPVATLVMEYAQEEKIQPLEVVNFAYSGLTPAQGKSVGEMEKDIIAQFTKKFPSLLKKGQDSEVFLFFLKGKYQDKIAAKGKEAEKFGVQGTPGIFVDGVFVNGFDQQQLNALLK